MKYVLLLALLIPAISQAARLGSPFPPAVDKRFDELENDLEDNDATARKYAKATYEPAVDGGNSNSENSLGIQLPAGAIVTRAIFYVNTAIEGEGGGIKGGSLAIQCAGDKDILAYIDPEQMPAGSFLHGEAAGANFAATTLISQAAPRIQGLGQSVSSACTLEVKVRGDSGDEDLASGKGTLILEYFNAN